MFTDSIDENIELLRELLAGLPPQHHRMAKKAATSIENVFTGLQNCRLRCAKRLTTNE